MYTITKYNYSPKKITTKIYLKKSIFAILFINELIKKREKSTKNPKGFIVSKLNTT